MYYEPELIEPEWCDRCFFGRSLWSSEKLCDYHYFWWVHQYYGKTNVNKDGLRITNNSKLLKKPRKLENIKN